MPLDIEYTEISDFLRDWGHVNRINIKQYPEYSTSMAIIEFKFEDEVEYFIKGLNNTTFDHYIINVSKLI